MGWVLFCSCIGEKVFFCLSFRLGCLWMFSFLFVFSEKAFFFYRYLHVPFLLNLGILSEISGHDR
jgi:hypothetical protein